MNILNKYKSFVRAFSFILLILFPLSVKAENWDYIRTSGLYYYGLGHGATEKEAIDVALAELTGMIATNVSSDFTGLDSESKANGTIDRKSKVLNCVKTYSQATLRNVEKWTEKKGNDIVAYCYMKRSEMEKIYEERITKAKDMLFIADEALQKRKIDMALQYFYWAYSLIRSVQRPSEVKDDQGRLLVNWLPVKMEDIMSDVSISFEKRDGDYVDLLFNYNGNPLSGLEFSYSDGRSECHGTAKDGRGMIEMAPGYETDIYHLAIEYEFKGQARGDAEMQSVLNVIPKRAFSRSEFKVSNRPLNSSAKVKTDAVAAEPTGVNLTPQTSQIIAKDEQYSEVISKIIDAIKSRRYSDVQRFFTLDGLDVYNRLISYGTGRVVGTPNLKFFKSTDGRVVVRGLQMSFSFRSGLKKTFVEDVTFTFNKDVKVENVAFGLGQIAENDILCKEAPGWKDETREMLMEFLENYKTAYCLKRIDYIRDVFADDAVIIIGNVTRRKGLRMERDPSISTEGQEVISYNRYTKDEYLKNLERCFNRNEFINIRFTNNDIQWLEKFKNDEKRKELFAIQIGQEYNSASYGDKGYLFLLVNMTDHTQPQIKVRTWQPNEVDMGKIFNAGDFYDE